MTYTDPIVRDWLATMHNAEAREYFHRIFKSVGCPDPSAGQALAGIGLYAKAHIPECRSLRDRIDAALTRARGA
jgi:hypothetical protein